MKITPETLVKILDLLCASPVIRHVAAAAGISEATYFSWWMRSRKNDPLFEVEWMGVRQQWAEHLKVCREVYLTHLEAGFIFRMERGTDTPVFWQGKPSWQLDHRFEGWSDDDMTALGYSPEEKYLHNPVTGARLIHTIHSDPPVMGALATLAAHSSKWRTKSDVNISGKVGLGVSVISRAAKEIEARVAPAQPALMPPVEVEAKDELSNEIEATLAPSEPLPAAVELPRAENFSTGLEVAVVDRTPAYVPPEGSSKIPVGPVKIFHSEAMVADDPPEIVGTDTEAATPADPSPAASRSPDVMLHTLVRQALRKVHDKQRGGSAIEAQLMNALTNTRLTPEQRTRRLQELVGGYRTADDRQEGLGAGIAAAPDRGTRMI